MQYRKADDERFCAQLSKLFVAGKIQNSRQNLLCSAREPDDEPEKAELKSRAEELSGITRWLTREAETTASARGF